MVANGEHGARDVIADPIPTLALREHGIEGGARIHEQIRAHVGADVGVPRLPVQDAGDYLIHGQAPAQHASPRQAERPSLTATPAMTSATAGSSHHRPKAALPTRPTSTAAARYPQSTFCMPSPRVAAEPSCSPTLRFAAPSSGIPTALVMAIPMPSQEVSGWCPTSKACRAP